MNKDKDDAVASDDQSDRVSAAEPGEHPGPGSLQHVFSEEVWLLDDTPKGKLRARYKKLFDMVGAGLAKMYEETEDPAHDPPPLGFFDGTFLPETALVPMDSISEDKHEAFDRFAVLAKLAAVADPEVIAGMLWAAYALNSETREREGEIILVVFEHPTGECASAVINVHRHEGAKATLSLKYMQITDGPQEGRMSNVFNRNHKEGTLS